jgi:hypothetical protein
MNGACVSLINSIETTRLIGIKVFRRMKYTPYVINPSFVALYETIFAEVVEVSFIP